MEIVHYIHYEKHWSYIIDNHDWKKYCYFGDWIWFAGEDVPERKAKEILKEMFPDKKIMKALVYHHGPRNKHESGSRPWKCKYNYKKEREFKNRRKYAE